MVGQQQGQQCVTVLAGRMENVELPEAEDVIVFCW